jgi:putative SOS response-associated peptidase YedK
MCGRAVQVSGVLPITVVCGLDVPDTCVANVPPRYNAAPRQELWVIRQNNDTGQRTLDLLRWGLIPHWCQDKPRVQPINARAEDVQKKSMFRDAYARRRCLVPVDLFFEWKAIKGARGKQPYAVGMKDGSPFGLGGLWENWKDPSTGEWVRTFTVVTTDSTELVAEIHNRMPLILHSEDYDRWLGTEPDPRDLLRPFPSALMRTWPISRRVNAPENNDPDLLTPLLPESGDSPASELNPS